MRKPGNQPQRLADVAERPGAASAQSDFLADVTAGLSAQAKHLPAKYFYDAAGSALFEEITQLPEYYPTRTELGILQTQGAEIGALVSAGAALIEFGSGASTKIRALLDHLPDLAVYVPVDVSGEMLADEAAALGRDYPRLAVHPVVGDFTQAFALPQEASGRAKAGFFPGSTIGNFDPPQAAAFLDHARQILAPGGTLIVGVDLVKEKAVLEAAYDDAAGVTGRFNLNMLARINRELGADFDLDGFAHRAFFNDRASRIEMHLVSRRSQAVVVGGRRFSFEVGETIHTENSYKYTIAGFEDLARGAGWNSSRVWTDPAGLFSVHGLSQPA
jgi:L-histidine N-alpha-methyltransferase